MGWLYRILDVGRGVELAINDAERLRGSGSIILAVFLDTLLAIMLAWAWWTYDLYSTWTWAGPLGAGWGAKLPEPLQPYNQWLIFVLNAAPTLIQWRFPSLARRHEAYFWAFTASALFDLVTDFPAVRADIDLYLGGIISGLGLLATPALWLAYLIGTILASFVFQSLFVIQSTRVIALLLRSGDVQRRKTVVIEE